MAAADDLDLLHTAAATMDDLFELGLPDAPGMAFVGGRFSARALDGTLVPFSAGAADEDRERAFRRCVGEVVETRAQFAAGGKQAHPAEEDGLTAAERAVLAETAGAEGIPAGWLPATRLADCSASSVPAALCLRDICAESPATSLGCAAGRSLAEATLSALFELIERDALGLWWRGGDTAGPIEEEAIPEATALLARVRAGAIARRTRFLDIGSDIGIPVVAAVSFDRDGRSVAAGFAARAGYDAAACAALRELAQMELGNRLVSAKLERGGTRALVEAERRQLRRMHDLDDGDPRFAARERALAITDLPTADPTVIARRLRRFGIEAHRVELTRPDCPVPVAKVVVPLLQPEPGTRITERLARMRELRGFRAGKVSSAGLI